MRLGCIILAAFLAILVFVIVFPGWNDARQRGKQKRAMGDLRAIATALEAYKAEHGHYPVQPSSRAGSRARGEAASPAGKKPR